MYGTVHSSTFQVPHTLKKTWIFMDPVLRATSSLSDGGKDQLGVGCFIICLSIIGAIGYILYVYQ